MKKKVLFLTGTRADYGKIKSLMRKVQDSEKFHLEIFVTGMHMLSKYGSTWMELEKDGFPNLYKFINQQLNSSMDVALSNTILGLGNYIHEMKPDLIVVHGDRLEALAGAVVGAFNNIRVAHIEGGEVSGTIDESIRHAISKLSHIHFVSNEEAKIRLIQMGEDFKNIFPIGSPDIDIMMSKDLPSIQDTKTRYDITYREYSIVMYHPVTTEIERLRSNVRNFVDALLDSEQNYVVIYPNNDQGTDIILAEYARLHNNSHFRIFPSIKFEHFLTLMRHANFVIGNSSAGIREASVYGIPSIDVGNRQKNRCNNKNPETVVHVQEDRADIMNAITKCTQMAHKPVLLYGDGESDERFIEILNSNDIWGVDIQKKFVDVKWG